MNEPDRSDIVDMLRHWVRQQQDRPVPERIVVFLAADDLAEFVRQNVVAAAILKSVPGAYAAAVFKAAPAWRQFVVESNPHIDSAMRTDPESPITIPVDWFDMGLSAPVRCPEPSWYERKLHEADLVLLPGMLGQDAARFPGLAAAPPVFRLPADRKAALAKELAERGVAGDRWFACVEGDDTFVDLARQAVERQGGQAVRVGEAAGQAGGLDLSGAGIEVQAAAVRFARYLIGGVGGYTGLASAFLTPVAALGADSLGWTVWNRDDAILENPTVLSAVADHLLERTAGCDGWRPAAKETPSPARKSVTFPLVADAEPLVSFWR
ncbi:MAG: hypothetical protein H7841_05770 [Magnetospirillum sp. WYHS-4]